MKDIWSWLYQIGDDDDIQTIAGLVDDLLDAHNASDSEAVRSIGELLIHHGKALNQPWLGVFARHWQLQHRLNDLSEGKAAVADAVSAFEIAHRDENLGCPQTICSTQDLCIAYSTTDGPGYAADVITACEDTLERIDPTWPCFDCVSTELVTGLLHAGRLDDAIERIDGTEVQIRQQGANPSLPYLSDRLTALLAMGRDAEALEVARTVDEGRYELHSDWSQHQLRHHQARAFLRSGNTGEAIALFTACPSPLDEPALTESWVLAANELLTADAISNDDELSFTAVRLAHLLHQRGALRKAFDVACFAARAAARRGAAGSAGRARQLAAAVQNDLVQPSMVDDVMAGIDRSIAEMPAAISDAAPLDQAVADLEAREAIGAGLGLEEREELAGRLFHQGWEAASESLFRASFERTPSVQTTGRLLEVLLMRGDLVAVEALAQEIEENDRSMATWARARIADVEERWTDVTELCASIVEREPDAQNSRRLWARGARELGDFGTSAKLMTELLDMWSSEDGQPSPDLWRAVVSGTLASDWALARRAAGDLGFELSTTDGPIDEEWEPCFITLIDDNGKPYTLQARRTGPATARIVEISLPDMEQRVGDLVVFEPIPLDPPPDDAGERFVPIRYAAIVTTESGGCSAFPVQGPAPMEDQWPTLRDAVHNAGFLIWAHNGGTYELDGETVPYFYGMAAHRPDQSAADLAVLLEDLTSGWEPKPFWIELAKACDLCVEDHEEREDKLWG